MKERIRTILIHLKHIYCRNMNTLSKSLYPARQKLLFPTMQKSFLCGETIPVKTVAWWYQIHG